ncbi:shikimate kinase [Synechococcus sp. CB0101]|jgi:shikimate kinase|uniref:shikimate kinase n=1 Tax=Synechococcus sp. CB0101 TaxID=232348 RepID=UPI0002002676|nr:shikimate kinase [Synechococcus sp. CB0101]QCH15394.1 shikimate kinase [Synechococcus sp. CB0101]
MANPHAELRQRLEGLNLYLVGMMGSGKSTAGRHLAELLGYRFLDADSSIEQVAGRSIPEVFASEGEAGFRQLEAAVLNQIASWHSLVVATGGGVVTRPDNWGQLHQGVVIWLDAPEELLLERLSSDPTPRPLLQADDPAARLAALLAERRPLYAQADLHIVQDGRAADQVAVQILEALPSVLKERTAAPQHRLQVINEAGEVGSSIN